jgi:integrase
MAGVRVGDRYIRYSTRVTDKEVATEIELAVRAIAQVHRWRPILDAVLSGDLHPALVYDAKMKGKLDQLEHEVHQGKSNPRLLDHVEAWQRTLASAGVGRRRSYEIAVLTLLKPSTRLSDLTRDRVQDWLNELRLDREMEPATIHGYFAGLRSLYGYLQGQGLIPMDDTRLVVARRKGSVGLKLPKVPRKVAQAASYELVAQLIAKAPESYKLALALAYGAGAESGALCRMRPDHIRAENVNDVQVFVPGSKTLTRERWVDVLDLFRPLVLRKAKELRGRVCPTRDPSKLSKIHMRLTAQIPGWPTNDEGKRLSLHKARHFFAITLLQRGAPEKVVATQLGHADTQMVQRFYGNYLPSRRERNRWASA